MPLVAVDREPVEVAHPSLAAEALLELGELPAPLRDGRVQLAGDEEALAEGPQELGQLLPTLRDQLEHQQERHRARVGLREVSEVVVARPLAAEGRAVLAHALLDERVADAV